MDGAFPIPPANTGASWSTPSGHTQLQTFSACSHFYTVVDVTPRFMHKNQAGDTEVLVKISNREFYGKEHSQICFKAESQVKPKAENVLRFFSAAPLAHSSWVFWLQWHLQLCWTMNACIHLQRASQPIYIVTFSENFNCIVCVFVVSIVRFGLSCIEWESQNFGAATVGALNELLAELKWAKESRHVRMRKRVS